MINIDRVKKLIDQIPEIKALFRPQNFQMFAPCDRATGQRKKTEGRIAGPGADRAVGPRDLYTQLL